MLSRFLRWKGPGCTYRSDLYWGHREDSDALCLRMACYEANVWPEALPVTSWQSAWHSPWCKTRSSCRNERSPLNRAISSASILELTTSSREVRFVVSPGDSQTAMVEDTPKRSAREWHEYRGGRQASSQREGIAQPTLATSDPYHRRDAFLSIAELSCIDSTRENFLEVEGDAHAVLSPGCRDTAD